MEPKKIFGEFPPVSKEKWKETAIKDLKGADFDKKLVWQTYDNFTVQPFYTAEDLKGFEGLVEGTASIQKAGTTWINYVEINDDDPKIINQKALLAIKEGATGIVFRVKGTQAFDFKTVLNKVDITSCHISFRMDAPSEKFINAYFDYLKAENIDLKLINGFVDSDILERWSIKGIKPDFDELEKQLKITQHAPGFRGLTIHSGSFVNAGSNTTQELAFLVNKVVEYLDRFTERKLSVETIVDEININSAISGDYFFEISKIRALRVLLSEILNAYGVKGKHINVLSSTSLWSKSFYDPNVNMLRNTTEAMSAILGGCDALLIHPHNASYEKPTEFSTRIALNVSNLLQGESYFDKVADPGKGSYYIEYLTQALSEKALIELKEIEAEGGFSKAIEKNIIQQKIEKVRSKKQSDIATRKQVYVGVNQYVNGKEKSAMVPRHEEQAERNGIKLLVPQRATTSFEQLRERTYQYFKNTGALPNVYLACFGNLAMRKARAAFTTNFFATAGFQVLGESYHESVQEGVKSSLDSDADIVVLCSSDEDYEKSAKEFVVRFKEAGSNKVLVLAGYPPALVDELKNAGIDMFIHVKTNAIEALSSLQDKFLATV